MDVALAAFVLRVVGIAMVSNKQQIQAIFSNRENY
jgi:hypothetical protein